MDITFGNDEITLGAAISPGDDGYVVLSLYITESNLPYTLREVMEAVGIIELNLCDHIMQDYNENISSYLLAIFTARKALIEEQKLQKNLYEDDPAPDTVH